MSPTRAGGEAAVAPPLRSRFSRESLIVAAALAAAAILAWAWLIRSPMAGDGGMDGMAGMAGMGGAIEPLSTAYLLPAFAMWAIMMVAMMIPSAAPMFLLHARIDKAPTPRGRALNSLIFAFSYILVWTAFSALAAFAQALLVNFGAVSAMALRAGSDGIAASLLLCAAAYELTAAKHLCLDKCQAPMLFILRHWTPGPAGAFRLGIRHGAYCLGCCWVLMGLLFVGGVMNLAWVAVLGIVVLGEKFAPPHWRAERFVAAMLALAAAALVLR